MNRNKMLTWTLIAGLLITMALLGGCYPTQAPSQGGGGSDWTLVIFLVLIFALFYFLMIRPRQKRQKAQQQLMQELKRGDKVITGGGIYGQIESVSEDSIVIKVESGATMRVAKGSVALKLEK
jgi:preprotein translocase subunit YajC